MPLPKNVCGLDRKLRALLGVALAVVAVRALEQNQGTRGTVLSAAAGEFLFNALIQFCPLNTLLGIDTCRGET